MRVLVDANVLLDYLLDREPFVQAARQVLYLCSIKKIHGSIAAHSIVNIFYILRKKYSSAQRKEILHNLCQTVTIVSIDSYRIYSALEDESFNDIEDYLQMKCAEAFPADYIVTRNCADFSASPIPAIEPGAFLALYAQED